MLDRYTILCEFRGGTYVSQSVAASAREAVDEWCMEMATKPPVADLSAALAQIFEANSEGPTPLDGLENVWCKSGECDGDLALLHIVKTQPASDNRNVFG
ncbi:hypothetical protein [Sphingopyxis sp.]|uniref:hypothetical protein n=1 Tax=Sphingopyxis sp. TaxID=1908224 RepID=UPI003D0BCF0D